MLVPTRVGMILVPEVAKMLPETCPHTRGDDPRTLVTVSSNASLVPTRVGMISRGNNIVDW